MIEEKRNELNLELRKLLSLLDLIDGMENEYPDYDGGLSEEEYLTQQLMLAVEARDRLQRVFKG